MKHSDIEKMLAAGLISEEQSRRIAEHFKMGEHESSRFMTIVLFIGAILVGCGIILLIASNWDAIPRGLKIISGLLLMAGAHVAGWCLRERPGRYPKSGEALHVVGAGLFLGNIALLGQIYHLSSRMPNAFLLWWAGIAVLPWVLRSKALHVMSIAAFCTWFGAELNERTGPIYLGDETQMLVYSLLGLAFLGFGYILRRTKFHDFSGPTEKAGLLGMILCFYPLTWTSFIRYSFQHTNPWIFPVMMLLGLGLAYYGVNGRKQLSTQWRWLWAASLTALVVVMALTYYADGGRTMYDPIRHQGLKWLATITLFIFLLLEIQVGVQLRSRFMVNLGTVALAIVIITTYINLFGSMAQTGLVFLFGGVFLIALGIYLEKQRRALVKKMIQTL